MLVLHICFWTIFLITQANGNISKDGCGLVNVPENILNQITEEDIRKEMLSWEKKRIQGELQRNEKKNRKEFEVSENEKPDQETVYVLGKLLDEGEIFETHCPNATKCFTFTLNSRFKSFHTNQSLVLANLIFARKSMTDQEREDNFTVTMIGRSGSSIRTVFFKVNSHDENQSKVFIHDITEKIKFYWPSISNSSQSIPFLTLKIECSTCETVWPIDIDLKMVPFLEIAFQHVSTNKIRRKRNSSPTCEPLYGFNNLKNISGDCCMVNLTVNFWEMGLDYVVSPRTYTTNFCGGQCFNTATGNYVRIMQAIYRQRLNERNWNETEKRALAELIPCCSPTIVRDLPVIIFDITEGKLKETKFAQIIVDSCGC